MLKEKRSDSRKLSKVLEIIRSFLTIILKASINSEGKITNFNINAGVLYNHFCTCTALNALVNALEIKPYACKIKLLHTEDFKRAQIQLLSH